jgi:phage shock protein E
LADKSFELLKADPRHPSLRYKRVGNFWSARVGLHYRALAIDIEDGVLWFWIGNHDDYEPLVATTRIKMAQHSEDFLELAAEAKARIKQITPDEALKLIKVGAVLLDVREKEEYEKSHLEGATHLSRGLLEMKIGEVAPDKGAAIVCYCAGGNRGAMAADTLQKMGYTNVLSIEGGMTACPFKPNES